MAKKVTRQTADMADEQVENADWARFLSQSAKFDRAVVWIVGTTPLICHAWSEKARLEMLKKQVRATGQGKAQRKPEEEFVASTYQVSPGIFGFPATAVKKSLLSVAHKDKGIARELVMRSLWIQAPFKQVRTAVGKAAVCDLPLLRLWGDAPIMREDMVKIGKGLTKTANLAYRAQFSTWALRARISYNSAVLNHNVLAVLINDAGRSCGIGDWRNEKSGPFGAFRLASAEEDAAWEAFSRGKGKMPERVGGDDFEDEFEFQQAAE